ncbi:alpha/beta fold hydrolase [Roseiterribacter gracilis]|uniref:Hydrolase n=1 Tax=Roseiterribacter gracilis TaxID=2812848 RepID=A0A8S8X7K6_9PROT|nr:hydrolase [Rhodospirillales bacterium TMPK1]
MTDDSNHLSLNGVRLGYARWTQPGTALPILLLHEGLGSVAMWRDFPARLARACGRTVIAWSRQGYGDSDLRAAPRDPDYMHREAALLPALFASLEIERAHLFGHSDGATIALLAAADDRAQQIASLALAAPHVFVEQVTIDGITAIRERYDELAPKLGRYHRDAAHVFYGWNDIWLDPRFRDWNIEAVLQQITVPTLLIQGVDDEYATMAQLDRIERGVRGPVQRLELAACGHSPHREQTAQVLTALRDHLAALP